MTIEGDAADTDVEAHREQVLAEAQARLDAEEVKDEAGLQHAGEVDKKLLGGMYTYPDRKWREHMGTVEADIPAGEAAMAARVGQGEERALAEDEERAKADEAIAEAADPTGAVAREAAATEAQVAHDLDDSMTRSVDLNVEASRARAAQQEHDPISARQIADEAQAELKTESADLNDADVALARLEADMTAAGETPAPDPERER